MKKKIFVSFDVKNDLDLMNQFREDNENYEFPFEIISSSDHLISIDEKTMKAILKTVDLVIVLCGYHTDQSLNVEGEFSHTIALKTKYMFLNGRNDLRVTTPIQAYMGDVIYSNNNHNVDLLYQKLFLSA